MKYRRPIKPSAYAARSARVMAATEAKWKERLLGKTFFLLTVEGIYHKRTIGNPRTMWMAICRCKCGRVKNKHANQVWSGDAKTCGCSLTVRGNKHHCWRGTKDIPSVFHKRFRKNAETRNIHFAISLDDIQDLWDKQKTRCFYTGRTLEWGSKDTSKMPSLDRLDSSKGYTLKNVVFTSWQINSMKGAMPAKKFIEVCGMIAAKRAARTAGAK